MVLSNSIWTIREAALSGDCVAILPIYSIVDELRSGALVPVFEDFMVESAMLNAFYRRSPQVPAKVRTLLNYLVEQYGGQPPWERRLLRDRPHLRRIVCGAISPS
jgi:DNA-binding transcriptional LysR family regulator